MQPLPALSMPDRQSCWALQVSMWTIARSSHKPANGLPSPAWWVARPSACSAEAHALRRAVMVHTVGRHLPHQAVVALSSPARSCTFGALRLAASPKHAFGVVFGTRQRAANAGVCPARGAQNCLHHVASTLQHAAAPEGRHFVSSGCLLVGPLAVPTWLVSLQYPVHDVAASQPCISGPFEATTSLTLATQLASGLHGMPP